MKLNHNLILAPVIMALGFTVPNVWLAALQIFAGMLYGLIGVLKLYYGDNW